MSGCHRLRKYLRGAHWNLSSCIEERDREAWGTQVVGSYVREKVRHGRESQVTVLPMTHVRLLQHVRPPRRRQSEGVIQVRLIGEVLRSSRVRDGPRYERRCHWGVMHSYGGAECGGQHLRV